MPDITMCHGYDCPRKETCYRYWARPSEFWQSWFADDPRESKNACAHYWLKEQTKKEDN